MANDTDRAAADLAARIASSEGPLPYRVVGYNPTTDDAGQVELFAQRSPLELEPLVIKVHPAILKQIVGAYIALEGRQQYAPVLEVARTIAERKQ